jgi:hypothetical protein
MSARYILFNLFLVVVSELVLCCHDMSCATIYFVGIGCQGGGLGGGGDWWVASGFLFSIFWGRGRCVERRRVQRRRVQHLLMV